MQKLPSLALSAVLALQLCVTATAQQEYKWGNVVMGGGGFVSAIITSKTEKNIIYARTDVGGAYKWIEADKSWVNITDWAGPLNTGVFGVEALALDPSNSARVYMLVGTEYWDQGKTMILRSDNYGQTFETIDVTSQFKTHGNGYGRQNGERLAVDPNDPNILLCGTRNNGLWKSKDRGSTWSKVASAPELANNLGICFVLFDPNKTANNMTSRIYMGLSSPSNNLYVSDDVGVTWELAAFPPLTRNLMPQRAVLTPGGRFLYVAAADGAGPGFDTGVKISRGAVLRYDTQEKTWLNISPENWVDDPPHPQFPNQTDHDAHFGGFGGITMNPSDSNHIIVSSINTWKPQFWDGTGRIAHGDKIFATTNGGDNWISVFGDLNDDHTPTGTEQTAVLYKNGYNWIEGEEGGRGESIHWAGSIEFDPFNSKRVFVTSGNGIYMADNFSAGQRFRFNFTAAGIEETVPMDLVSIPGGPLITVIMDYDGFVHHDISKPVSGSRHSPQMGSTWSVDYAKLQPNIVVRGGGNNNTPGHNDYRFPLYYSEDTGSTWKALATDPCPGQHYEGRVAVSSDGRVVLWAPKERNVIYRSADWGANWTASTGISSSIPFQKADPVDPAVFYAFSGGRVFVSDDTGKTFTAGSALNNVSWTKDLQVTPGVKGHVWVVGVGWDEKTQENPVTGSLMRSVDGGLTFHSVDPDTDPAYTQKVQHAEAVGFGKAAPGAAYPAIYLYGTINNVRGVWQSIDEAKSWTRVDDDMHRYGSLANGNFVRGDMNTFGVVYRSTAGRGIAARMPAEWLNNQTASTRYTVKARRSPNVKLNGQLLTLRPSNGPLNVRIYNLKGRLLFNRTYNSAITLKTRDLVKSKGSYIISVRNGSKEMVFNSKLTLVSNYK
ncbi:MAG: hypothetical protein LBI42_04780 [Chitinispirillales bacterium]|jgi:photosystem II stability/assembly factor-like uncharacterized protein|nr:hypothetical protein [Chitinispirillales bacterium]